MVKFLMIMTRRRRRRRRGKRRIVIVFSPVFHSCRRISPALSTSNLKRLFTCIAALTILAIGLFFSKHQQRKEKTYLHRPTLLLLPTMDTDTNTGSKWPVLQRQYTFGMRCNCLTELNSHHSQLAPSSYSLV